jgi:AcrR family transcriptional regulator
VSAKPSPVSKVSPKRVRPAPDAPPAEPPAPESPESAPASRSRRAPDPADRQRDADRTRQRILDAALGEFADKGYAGARVREIADRAGVNAQLISYYFGGKEGLYEELIRRWHQREANLEQLDLSLADLVLGYLQVGFDQPELMRMFVWENLTRTRGSRAGGAASDGDPPEVADLRRRQAAGEIADDIDPACLLVAIMGAVSAPSTMPQEIERLCGVPAASEEFHKRYGDQLRIVLGHLAAPSGEQPQEKIMPVPSASGSSMPNNANRRKG